jgi:heat shock protein HslJ
MPLFLPQSKPQASRFQLPTRRQPLWRDGEGHGIHCPIYALCHDRGPLLFALIVYLTRATPRRIAGAPLGALGFGGLPLPSNIAEATWTLQSYSSDGMDVPLPARVSVFIDFHRLGQDFSGSDGCNSYFGKFSSRWPGRLSLSNLGQALVACPGEVDRFEMRYLADLPRVESYYTSSGGLVLTGEGGRVAFCFTAGGA